MAKNYNYNEAVNLIYGKKVLALARENRVKGIVLPYGYEKGFTSADIARLRKDEKSSIISKLAKKGIKDIDAAYSDLVNRIKKEKAAEAKRLREELEIRRNGGDALYHLRLGEHYTLAWKRTEKQSCITYEESYERYSSRCTYTKIDRDFTMYVQRGWVVRVIGGLITFLPRGWKRTGSRCIWVEQGRSISDISNVAGWLVRGQHIVADSLAEARKIALKQRAEQLPLALKALKQQRTLMVKRRKAVEAMMAREKRLLEMPVTFADSLAAGNCEAGTKNFVRLVSAALGYEVKELPLGEVLHYANKFNVLAYAKKIERMYENRL